MRDRERGESKGYGFAVFVDRANTETAIVGLNGLSIEGRTLTCRKCDLAAPGWTASKLGRVCALLFLFLRRDLTLAAVGRRQRAPLASSN